MGIHTVSDGKSLDCLIFGCATTAVAASDRLYMATTLFVATAEDISVLDILADWDWETVLGCALLDHDCGFCDEVLERSREQYGRESLTDLLCGDLLLLVVFSKS